MTRRGMRWMVAVAVVLWLAPSTVSTGRIPGGAIHVDAAVLVTGSPRAEDMAVIDDRVRAALP